MADRLTVKLTLILSFVKGVVVFSSLMPLFGSQKGHLAHKNFSLRYVVDYWLTQLSLANPGKHGN